MLLDQVPILAPSQCRIGDQIVVTYKVKNSNVYKGFVTQNNTERQTLHVDIRLVNRADGTSAKSSTDSIVNAMFRYLEINVIAETFLEKVYSQIEMELPC